MKKIGVVYLRDFVEIALFCAIAIVLDQFVKIPIGAAGGSLNLSAVPLFIIALRHGPIKGFFAGGVVYGVITCLLDNWGFMWYPLDYLLSFGSICILGLFARNINNNFENKKGTSYLMTILSIISWGILRFVFTSIDGVILSNDPNMTLIFSMGYNAPYVFSSAAIDLVIVCALLPLIVKINHKFKTMHLSYTKKEEQEEA
ncbi:MAG: ECF transporter S component [Candidatus Caccosoma sp.]|nr:ECF transporter S component [Candidatus Caccosoma sp.]